MRVWGHQDIVDFSHVGGDANPIHLDDEYVWWRPSSGWVAGAYVVALLARFASKTRFGKRIAHGMLSAGLFGTALATCIPGAVYLSQNLRFVAPVYLDTPVVARVEVAEATGRKVHFKTTAFCIPPVGAEAVEQAAIDGDSAWDLVREEDAAQRFLVIDGEASVMLPKA